MDKTYGVSVDCLLGHGGLFTVKGVGQKIMADALGVPVAVMESAGEGGAWGIALLAAYAARNNEESLDEFLSKRVFAGNEGVSVKPDPGDAKGFAKFMENYKKGLAVQNTAAEIIKESCTKLFPTLAA